MVPPVVVSNADRHRSGNPETGRVLVHPRIAHFVGRAAAAVLAVLAGPVLIECEGAVEIFLAALALVAVAA
jgi:hypothetical protein